MRRHGDVPINIAEELMEHRLWEVERKTMTLNHARVMDAGRLPGILFLYLHTRQTI